MYKERQDSNTETKLELFGVVELARILAKPLVPSEH